MTPLICALLLDLDDSADFSGNTGTAFGRPLSAYPLMAARTSAHVRRIFVCTASPAVKSTALQYDAVIMDPPPFDPRQPDAVFQLLRHAYQQVIHDLRAEAAEPELLAVLFSNAAAVTKDVIDAGIDILLERPEIDSAISVTGGLRFTPDMAREETAEGLLSPCSAAPSSQTQEIWYPSWGASIIRPQCIEKPQGNDGRSWLGSAIYPLKQWGPGPIDFHWQIPGLEYWLKKHAIPDLSPNLEMQPRPQPQLAPKGDRR